MHISLPTAKDMAMCETARLMLRSEILNRAT